MFFSVKEEKSMHQGQIIYKDNDLAFDFLPHQMSNCTVLIGAINMDFIIYSDNVKRASQIWGYHPLTHIWIQKELYTPSFLQGSLVLLDNTIEDTDIIQLEDTFQWKTYHDYRTGWICIGSDEQEEDDIAVEFATNIVAVVYQQRLKALWVKPIFQ